MRYKDPAARPVNPIRSVPSAEADPLPPPESVLRRFLPGLFGSRAGKPSSRRPAPFMSEGIRQDLLVHGWAIDSSSGATFVREPETGTITVTSADGAVNVIEPRKT